MKIPIYQVDAFARRVFGGNPAAVCPLESWIYDRTLQQIAAENNVSETAFIVPARGEWEIRWFTPLCEVDLCGHGTLAAGWVVLTHLAPARQAVRFSSKSGPLRVEREASGARLTVALPRRDPFASATPNAALTAALGAAPEQILVAGETTLCVFADGQTVARLEPRFAQLAALRSTIVATAPGSGFDCDFVSRVFAPHHGLDEDPVTGSAHCVSLPYWSQRLGRDALFAKQLSKRGGELWCRLGTHEVLLGGCVTPYLAGEIDV